MGIVILFRFVRKVNAFLLLHVLLLSCPSLKETGTAQPEPFILFCVICAIRLVPDGTMSIYSSVQHSLCSYHQDLN